MQTLKQRIFSRLVREDLSVAQLSVELGASHNTIGNALRVLKKQGRVRIVTRRLDGERTRYKKIVDVYTSNVAQ